MYHAELKGKLPSSIEQKEDILTSNVFSFFDYADRKTYLKGFLEDLGINLTEKEAEQAEFDFWPKLDDRIEPDLVILAGKFFILIESKYLSDFSNSYDIKGHQLSREVTVGAYRARNLGREFRIIAVTSDYVEPKEKFSKLRNSNFLWINWQSVTIFLEKKIRENCPQQRFANDLYSLLKKKNLRPFFGFTILKDITQIECRQSVFFDYTSSKFRGRFIGFAKSLENLGKLAKADRIFFASLNTL